jgi:ribonuclease HI
MTRWVHDWARRDWRRKTGTIENLALWQDAVRAAAAHQVAWRWVRGHDGHAQNEYANDLAVKAASTLTASGGLIDSGFDAWADVRQSTSRNGLRLEPFPTSAEFAAGPRLPGVGEGRPSL